ncbi:hypothetical protein D3C85_509880 [compost metagenome]
MTTRYQHTQVEPSSVWVVRHNLYTRAPIVDAFIEIAGVIQKIQPKAVKVISDMEIHIEWSVPRTGKAGVV